MPQIKCTAIILAGGKSERMGQPKGLLDFFGRLWIQEQLNRLKLGGIKTVYLGLGYDANKYFEALPILMESAIKAIDYQGLKLRVVINNNPKYGSFSTLQSVLNKMQAPNSILISPIDVPILNNTELQLFLQQDGTIIKPQYKGKSGHPIYLNKVVFEDLLKLDKNYRLDNFVSLNSKFASKLWNCSDGQILFNLNSPQKWNAYKVYYQSHFGV